MKMYKLILGKILVTFPVFVIWSLSPCSAQLSLSGEFQVYPTGLIPGIKIEHGLSAHESIGLRIGYNWFRHRDLGVHEDERGDGFGCTIGYKRYIKEMHKGLFVGIRSDLWWNEVDWKDGLGGADEESGLTRITVVQPTVELGYAFRTASDFVVSPAIALGFEWNVKTNGAPTGEGAIVLLGISIGKIF